MQLPISLFALLDRPWHVVISILKTCHIKFHNDHHHATVRALLATPPSSYQGHTTTSICLSPERNLPSRQYSTVLYSRRQGLRRNRVYHIQPEYNNDLLNTLFQRIPRSRPTNPSRLLSLRRPRRSSRPLPLLRQRIHQNHQCRSPGLRSTSL
jgi:hypothetical protein